MKNYGISRKIIIISMLTFLIVLFLFIFKFNISNAKNQNVDASTKSELSGTITFVSNRTDKSKEINRLIKEFESEHPKVKVNLELIGDTEEILKRKASVGELDDVTAVPQVINVSDFSNYFLPLDDLGFNENNTYNCSSSRGNNGKLYALTTSLTWQGVIYNKKIFNEAGIHKLPTTIKEFYDACDKIKMIGAIPIALSYKQQWGMNMWIDSLPYLLDKDLERKVIVEGKDILSDGSSVYKSLEIAHQIIDKGYCESNLFDYDWQQCKSDLRDGKVAMFIWNSDFKHQLEDIGADKDQFDMFPIPGTEEIVVDGDYKFAVSKDTAYPETAKAFLKFMFENDRYSKAVNIMSSSKKNKDNIDMLEKLKSFKLALTMQEDVSKAQTVKDINNHNEFYDLRKLTEMDGKFVQQYTITKDTKSLREEFNNKWNEFRLTLKKQ